MYMGRFGTAYSGKSSGLTTGGATTGVSSQLIGPFKERDGCPPGSVVAHRFGQGTKRKVQCRVIQKAAPVQAPPRPAPAAQQQVFTPTITVSPAIQTEVSPQISPVFQQTGRGAQTAGTTMTAPGGMSAPTGAGAGSPQTGASMADIAAMMQKQEQARAAERKAEREEEQRRYERQQQAEQQRYQREEMQRQRELQERQVQMQREAFEREEREAQMRADREAAMQPAGAPPPSTAPITIPGAQILSPQVAPMPEVSTGVQVIEPELPWPLIIGGGIVLIGGAAYYMQTRKGKRKR